MVGGKGKAYLFIAQTVLTRVVDVDPDSIILSLRIKIRNPDPGVRK
jgi:hypothetical protein